jgi:DNA-binding transcriptional ArsR family regulator
MARSAGRTALGYWRLTLGSEVVATGAPDRATLDAVVVGPAAADVRRAVGPVAWCALEYLAASPAGAHGDGDTVAASVRSLATGLRVSKNTAHRALSVLRAAGLVESIQSRGDDGHFQVGCYRLAVADDVVARVQREQPRAATSSRRDARSVAGRQAAVAPEIREFAEPLVLLPPD